VTLPQRMRANAELLDAMLDNQVRLDRRTLDGLVADLWAWAEELEAQQPQARLPLLRVIRGSKAA